MMSALIDPKRRAATRAAAVERSERLLAVSREMLGRLPRSQVTLEMVCQRANIKAGLAAMYFGTIDEIVVRLLREELTAWYDWLEDRLAQPPGNDSGPGSLIEDIADDVMERKLLVRLLAEQAAVVEQGSDPASALGLLRWQWGRLGEVGARLEKLAPSIGAGRGRRVALELQLRVSAWAPLTNPHGVMAMSLEAPDLCDLRLDLREGVRDLLHSTPMADH
jgi:AcrR family transcriptional regulator